jgi:PBSX family phage portal protein
MSDAKKTATPMAFTFGEPESVLSNNMYDSLGLFLNPYGEFYEPTVSQKGLAKLLGANAHHGTIPFLRKHMLAKYYQADKSPALSREDLANAGFDYDIFGHCYFRRGFNGLGQCISLYHLPALNMRKHKEADVFCMLQPNGAAPVKFMPGEVVQLKRYDPMQQIYGMVEYFGAINSVLLNEDSTLFRRRYYCNGAHMGYIFYLADAEMDEADENLLKEQIKNSKGVGNFRSMFLNIPGGKEKSVQIIPIGDISQKDEFAMIKNISRNDILAAWRMPPALAGVIPENVGGYGDIDKIDRVYFEYEIEPRQQVFLQLNRSLHPTRQISFTRPVTSTV